MPHTIGKNVQALRKKRGLSCAQVAKLAQLSRSSIYSIEAGEYQGVNSGTLAALSKVFGVGLDELTGTRRPARRS